MKRFSGFEHGMGIGGWLTNYKRFNVLPNDRRLCLTIGDMEHFESYVTKKDIEYIASLGMDHIRLGFDQIVIEEEPYKYRECIFNLIDNFIGWCEEYGLNIVLNMHKAIGNYCDIKEAVDLVDDDELQKRFIAVWLAFEERYKNKPEVAFELLNEVRDIDPEKWNRLAQKTLDALREKNKERLIVIGSTKYNAADKLCYLDIKDDDKVIYTFHMYEPFEFTHQQGVLQAPTCYYNRKMEYPGDIEKYRDYQKVVHGIENAYEGYEIMDKRFIYEHLQPAVDFIKAHPDRILWCGEFGTIRHAKPEYRENWMRDMISFLKDNDIPYCVWNYLSTYNDGNRFSLVDDIDRKILTPELAKIIRGEV